MNEQGGIYNAYEARSYAVVDVAADAAGSAPAVEAGEVSRSVKLVMKYRLVR
ncbi:MAG: hypothetical protein HC843_07805 [Sphingomonadales bacterium]|nr:hypothetical protein [Sphingomonadales bacterium]